MEIIQNVFSFILLYPLLCESETPPITNNLKFKDKSITHPPCKACTILTDSFKKGMEKTTRGKYEGGDAAWEEEKLGIYKNSEVRLTEIQEFLCTGISHGQDQCHTLASDNEHLIEEWWFKHQNNHPDIFEWLCINELKVCCPPNHFGPTCELCSDCNGNGKCKGNGTRKGNGKCSCDTGYTGEFCNECAIQYYEAFKDENKLLCSACHTSCGSNGCTGSGTKNCRSCKSGWAMTPDSGCLDINECIENPNICKENQFCINNDGSYTCLDCDRSCNGCEGDGPDMCKKCAEGYELREGKCIALNTTEPNHKVDDDDHSEL